MADQDIQQADQRQLAKLGERITARRKALGFKSYEEFAVKKGFNRGQYWRYEQGENMKILNLAKVAAALEISLAELIKDCF